LSNKIANVSYSFINYGEQNFTLKSEAKVSYEYKINNETRYKVMKGFGGGEAYVGKQFSDSIFVSLENSPEKYKVRIEITSPEGIVYETETKDFIH
ncbi:MAG: hypothetical protein AB1779_02965, partial [Candidatus Thermoplasmatota archaeon]